jgi:hypothetical protein
MVKVLDPAVKPVNTCCRVKLQTSAAVWLIQNKAQLSLDATEVAPETATEIAEVAAEELLKCQAPNQTMAEVPVVTVAAGPEDPAKAPYEVETVVSEGDAIDCPFA